MWKALRISKMLHTFLIHFSSADYLSTFVHMFSRFQRLRFCAQTSAVCTVKEKKQTITNWKHKLVDGFNPSEPISQLGCLFPIYGKIKFMFQTTNQQKKPLGIAIIPAWIASSHSWPSSPWAWWVSSGQSMGCPKCYTLFAGNHGTSQLLNIGNYVSHIFIVYIYDIIYIIL